MALDSRIQVDARSELELDGATEESFEVAILPFPAGQPKVSVVIPTLNEERNITWVLERIPPLVDEIILVDGRSTDLTVGIAQAVRPDLVVIREEQPGKGIALRTAFAAATGDIIVMLDADCSMDPRDIEHYVAAIEAGADLVKGSRYLPGGGSVDISKLRQFGNAGLLRATNFLYRTSFTERDRDRRPRCPGGPPDQRGRQLRIRAPLRDLPPQHLPRRVPGSQDSVARAIPGDRSRSGPSGARDGLNSGAGAFRGAVRRQGRLWRPRGL
jgi:hypothetical protein